MAPRIKIDSKFTLKQIFLNMCDVFFKRVRHFALFLFSTEAHLRMPLLRLSARPVDGADRSCCRRA